MEVFNNPAHTVIATGMSSEEGGRFNQDENDYRIILIEESIHLEHTMNYHWVSLAQVRSLIRFNNFFTNELRSLLALMSSKF